MSVRRDHRRFVSALERAVVWAEDPESFDARDGDVSDWSVGRHLEHLLRANRGIVDWLAPTIAGEEPELRGDPDGRPTIVGRAVLLTGYLPRGVGKAPGRTVPEGVDRVVVAEGLRSVLATAREMAAGLDVIERSEARMTHPALGTFDAAQWLRFARIHHHHHEKIVRDLI